MPASSSEQATPRRLTAGGEISPPPPMMVPRPITSGSLVNTHPPAAPPTVIGPPLLGGISSASAVINQPLASSLFMEVPQRCASTKRAEQALHGMSALSKNDLHLPTR